MALPISPLGPKMPDVDNNEALAKVKNVAYNKNWNVVYFPYYSEEENGNCEKSVGVPNPAQDLAGMMKDENEEKEAEAFAAGKASVWNKNINIVIYR